MTKRAHQATEAAEVLKGWKAIADFMGQPLAVVERWAKAGLPVRRVGRYTIARPEELQAWMSREIGAPAPLAEDSDFREELRASVAAAKQQRRLHRVK